MVVTIFKGIFLQFSAFMFGACCSGQLLLKSSLSVRVAKISLWLSAGCVKADMRKEVMQVPEPDF